MRITKWTTGVMLAAGILLVSGGCADKLTRSHFEMIELNISNTDDVARTIGDPSYKLDDQWHYERVDKHLNVIINFSDQGVVARKQWIDARGDGVWEDTQQPGDTDTHESTKIRSINE
ncbi:MAG: hypothetical protein KAV82_03115 [Phycisphaerae bacterium]|nr:hypothetical protein [Phycisphaerae bacterium]